MAEGGTPSPQENSQSDGNVRWRGVPAGKVLPLSTTSHKGVSKVEDNSNNAKMSTDESGLCGIQWKKVTFQAKLIWTLYSMVVYVNKIYEDCNTVAVYYREQQIYYTIVTGLCLILPTVAYMVYVVTDQFNKKRAVPEVKEPGSGTIHGLLLVPWQIKSRADQLYYISQKCCQVRKPTNQEEEEISQLERKASVLEFFEEFIAGFIQLILQTYIMVLFLETKEGSNPLKTQLVASGLGLFSMILAVKRKDDGILTGFLSTIGWVCMFISRSFAIALGAAVIHSWIMVFCILHALGVTIWVTKIAFDSYPQNDEDGCTVLSKRKKISIFFLVFTLFGVPSLAYWPLMFQLKERFRPYIFTLIMILENAGLFAIWYFLGVREVREDYLIRYALLAGLCVIGGLFISLYLCCKPAGTEKVVQHDMKVKSAASFGLYFDFCNATFHLPDDAHFNRLLNEVRQRQQEIPLKSV